MISTMKKSILAKLVIGCIALLMFNTLSFAQESSTARAEKNTQRLKEELQLSEDQVSKVQVANQKRMEQMQNIRAEGKGERKEKMSKIKAIMDEYDKEMKAILTPDQYTKFEQIKDEQRDKLMDRRKGKRNKGR